MMAWVPLLAQTEFLPKEGQEAWPWVAGMAVGGLVYLGKRHLDAVKEELDECRKTNATLTTELGKTSTSLEKMTDVTERQRQTMDGGFAKQLQITAEGFERIMDLIAPRRKERP